MKISRSARILLTVQLSIVLVVTTLTYLPNLSKATIYRDDWYYTIDRLLGGPQAYHFMFSIDRPARGYFFEAYYQLFGIEPLPYHLTSFAFRLLLGAAAFWLILTLWPKRWQAAMVISLLLLIYPGYTRWMEGFENQPNIVSLFCEVASILLTLLAIQTRRLPLKIALWVGSIVSGLVYLLLIDYAIGMEAFRWLCIYLILQHAAKSRSWLLNGLAALRAGLPAALIPGIFLFWRLFIFVNQRAETDLNAQLGAVFESPLMGLAAWFINLIKSILNTGILAWASAPVDSFFSLSKTEVFTGLLFASAAAGCILLGLYILKVTDAQREDETTLNEPIWHVEAIWLGLIGLVFGVLPVVFVNRAVALGPFSHYSVPVSLAAAMLAGGLLYAIRSAILRNTAFITLVMLAVLTHYSASAQVLIEEQTANRFWHQVVWRAPGIRESSGLLVAYPNIRYGEDVDAVAGPANFLYFPQPQNELPVRYKLQAMKQYPWTVNEYLTGKSYTMAYRSHFGEINPNNLLVMTQSTPQACVHIIDQRNPWFSFNDPSEIVVVGESSNIDNILPGSQPPALPPAIFGPEPEHRWCYYFQKAELALQQENWEGIRLLAGEVFQQKLHPVERLEWMPFLQAYARLDDVEGYRGLLARMSESDFNRVQICNVLTRMQEQGGPFSAAMNREISDGRTCPQTSAK